jgi:hypothetical protein
MGQCGGRELFLLAEAERKARKTYRTHEAMADVFNYTDAFTIRSAGIRRSYI